MIRLTVPSIESADLQAVSEAVSSGFLVQGKRVAAFEHALAAYVGTQYAVAVSNCTAALHISLLSLGVGSGDLVIVPAYSWPATANVVELCGAHPVFIDIYADTFNMDVSQLQATLDRLFSNSTTARKVKCILPVHTFGQSANMQAITEIARRFGIAVVEDAACALGAKAHGKGAGTWGTAGCFSFHPRKAITTGEGGVVTTDDPATARILRALRNHGLDPEAESADFILAGFNYRITEFQAALGTVQLGKIRRILETRTKLSARYLQLLEGTGIRPPARCEGYEPTYQSYVVLLPLDKAQKRADLIRHMAAEGIEVTIGTWHIPMTSYYRSRYGYRSGDFPVTDDVFSRSLTLPLHEYLKEEDQQKVVGALCRYMKV